MLQWIWTKVSEMKNKQILHQRSLEYTHKWMNNDKENMERGNWKIEKR